MASQSQGIQQLLHAEKRAAEKVAEARKRKARRLRQAKEEKIQAMQANHHRNKEKVLRQLLMLVCDIKPEIHHNYRFNI
ncbi:V-type proton ATPase subunit G 1-like isoform X3 [Heptranchias perlo]|uniref:V-type proton ATPase subunit G 1-like isoform X3 n=1 Tax=Heptranchias perlo TaxID=212740 RepID=UPI00355A996E